MEKQNKRDDIPLKLPKLLINNQIINRESSNIFQNLLFLFKTKNKLVPSIFLNKYITINHKYQTIHNKCNFYLPKNNIKITNFSISYRPPYLWNKFLETSLKSLESLPLFREKVKVNLLTREDELTFF